MTATTGSGVPLRVRLRFWVLAGTAIGVGILGALVVGAFRPGWGTVPPVPGREVGIEGLFIPPDRLDFGRVWESSEFSWVLPVENCQQRDVLIDEFITSCTCTNVEPRSVLVPSGQTREVRLALDLTQGPPSTPAAHSEHAFEVAIGPKVRDGKSPAAGDRWVVRGTVRPLLHLERPAVHFGDLSELTPTVSSRHTRVTSVIPLKSLMVTSDPLLLPAVVQRVPGDGEQFELTVSVPPPPRPGPIQHDIVLAAGLDTGEVVKKTVRVTGRVVKDCQCSPPEAALGARLVGETAEESLTLYSLTQRPLELVGTAVEGDGLSVEAASVVGVGGVTVRLRQRILKLGEQTGKASFRVRAGGGDVAEVVVPVSSHGIEP